MSETAAPDAPDASEALSSLRATLAAAAEGVLFVSESEAPFVPVVLPPEPGAAGAPPTVDEIRRRFGVDDAAPGAERTLDDFFRYGIAEVDPASVQDQAAIPSVLALCETVRRVAPDARAFRVGDGAEVRYLIVGHAAEAEAPGAAGALAGLETTGFES